MEHRIWNLERGCRYRCRYLGIEIGGGMGVDNGICATSPYLWFDLGR